MDELIQSLTLHSEAVVDDVVLPCLKIHMWLQKSVGREMEYKEVELMLKAAVYLNECFIMFGEELRKSLTNLNPISDLQYTSTLQEVKQYEFLPNVCKSILFSKNGIKYIGVIQQFIQFLGTIDIEINLNENIRPYDNIEMPSNKEMLLNIVEKLFNVPHDLIEETVEKLLANFDFKILGHIFLDRKEGNFANMLTILEEMICKLLKSFNVPSQFLYSLFSNTSKSEEGLEFFFKCMSNKLFAESLIKYIILFLENLSRNINSCECSHVNCIFFLVQKCLAIKSPCFIEMHSNLSSSTLSNDFIDSVLKLNFIYD